jgi:hypothetical protein
MASVKRPRKRKVIPSSCRADHRPFQSSISTQIEKAPWQHSMALSSWRTFSCASARWIRIHASAVRSPSFRVTARAAPSGVPPVAHQVEDDRDRGREPPGQDVITCPCDLAEDRYEVREFAVGPLPCLQVGREGQQAGR